MQSVIGALRATLGLDSAQFHQGLKRAESGAQRFAKAAAIALTAAAVAATGAFMAISGAAQRADRQMKASQSYGIPIEQLGRLAHAAELSGSSMEEVGKAGQRASRAVNDAMNGISNAGTRAFEQLGVALTNTNGSARDVESILGDVAEQFANMPDGAQKSALAIEMFGRSGANLIPLLNQGRQGLKDMGDEAEKLGLVFDERTGRASEQFNDNMLRLQRTMTGLWNQVLGNVIGGFAQLTDKIVASTQASGGLDLAVSAISAAMNVLVRVLGVVVDNFEFLIGVVRTFIGIKIVLFLGSVATAMVAFARTVRVTGLTVAAVTKLIGGKIQALILLAAVIAEVTGATQTLVGWLERTGQAVYSVLPEGLRQSIDGVADMFSHLGGSIEGVSGLTADMFGTAYAGADLAASGFERVGAGASQTAGAIDLARESLHGLGQVGQSVLSGLGDRFADMALSAFDGTKSIAQSFGDMFRDIGRQYLASGIQQMINSLLGGFGGSFRAPTSFISGGFFPGLPGLGRGIPGFDGGGFTGLGARVGGLDGKGGFLAMLHPNETVVDHTKGQGGASKLHITTGVAVDGQGSITSYVKSVVQDGIEIFNEALPQRVQQINADPRAR